MPDLLNKQLDELVSEGIISQETADGIRNYYENKNDSAPGRLYIVFGIIGALLVSMGMILIIAHNWDQLSRFTKSIVAFIPMIAGQAICAYALVRKSENTMWREASSAFLIFALAGCISLISQIYNIDGKLGDFLLTWMLLCLPLIYIMQSGMASLLCIIGITWYVSEQGFFHSYSESTNFYCLMLASILPFYYILYRKNPTGNFLSFHNWLLPLSMLFALAHINRSDEVLLLPAYMCMLGLFYIAGNSIFFRSGKLITNGFIIIGSVGTIMLLIFLSFSSFWEGIAGDENLLLKPQSPEWIAMAILFVVSCILLFYTRANNKAAGFDLMEVVFILFLIIFFIGFSNTIIPVLVINLLLFALGITKILRGARLDHLGILNYGLLIIASLITSRFFDIDLSYLSRGILFILVGAGFFAGNYWMIQKRKSKNSILKS